MKLNYLHLIGLCTGMFILVPSDLIPQKNSSGHPVHYLVEELQQTETELAEKLDKIPDILKDDGYPDVQAFMKTYRKAEAIVIQYNQDLAEWEQAVKNGQKPAEKQHRPPERQSVRNRLRQLQEDGKQNSQPKQRKKSQDRER